MSIPAASVKRLRDLSGAGMMDAKRALVENDGDMDAAIDWLRTKGLAKAAKKSGRTAAEGLVGVAVEGGIGVVVEVNAETDFVAKNKDFQALVRDITDAALRVRDLNALVAAEINGVAVLDAVQEKIATIGENMSVRRMARVEGEHVASYVHNAAAPGMGKIGVLVAVNGEDSVVAKQVAMHVAASSPISLSESDMDPSIVERERAIFAEQARQSGKPDNIIESMTKGRMRKFFEESTLLAQKFVMDPDCRVRDVVSQAGLEILGFARFEVGEGIDKEEEDFAAEVAKAAGG